MPKRNEAVSTEAGESPNASTSGTFAINSTYEQRAEATHKLGNLMALAMSLTEILAEGVAEPEELSGIYQKLRSTIQEAAQLSRQLLSSTRQAPPRPLMVDLNLEIAKFINIASRIVKDKINVSAVLAPSLGKINIDPFHLEQIMLNLVTNARDAMPNGGQLIFETRNEASDIVFIVRDTGIGIDAALHAEIFEPFFTTKDAEKGTGVGLSTVLKFVKQAGGSIEVQSAKNAGASFILRFPCAKE